ncbi:MAG: hypothetical protein PHQ64_00925 [Bacilli bacterium]|nr:hypothetical protein [Bacilli bacterium]
MYLKDFGNKVNKMVVYDYYYTLIENFEDYDDVTKARMINELHNFFSEDIYRLINLLDLELVEIIRENLNVNDLSFSSKGNFYYLPILFEMKENKYYIFEECRGLVEKIKNIEIDLGKQEEINKCVLIIEALLKGYFYIEESNLVDITKKYCKFSKHEILEILQNNSSFKVKNGSQILNHNNTSKRYYYNIEDMNRAIDNNEEDMIIQNILSFQGKYKIFSKEELEKTISRGKKNNIIFDISSSISREILYAVKKGLHPDTILKYIADGVMRVYTCNRPSYTEIYNYICTLPIWTCKGNSFFDITKTREVKEIYPFKKCDIVMDYFKDIGVVCNAKDDIYIVKFYDEIKKISVYNDKLTDIRLTEKEIFKNNIGKLPDKDAKCFYNVYYDLFMYINKKKKLVNDNEFKTKFYDATDPNIIYPFFEYMEKNPNIINEYLLDKENYFTKEELLILNAIQRRKNGIFEYKGFVGEKILLEHLESGDLIEFCGINNTSKYICRNIKEGTKVFLNYVPYKNVYVIEFLIASF